MDLLNFKYMEPAEDEVYPSHRDESKLGRRRHKTYNMKDNLNHYLQQAKEKKEAIGHFNFATADVLKAIVEGSKEAGAKTVMVGTSEGEANFLGLKEAVALVKAVGEDYNFPVFLNADH